MRSLNKVIILGNLTKDPENKIVGSGLSVTKFTVATNRNWTGKNETGEVHTDFHKVVVWRKLADICVKYLKKGSAVLVEGKLTNNSFKTKDDKKVSNTEIVADEISFISYNKSKDVEEINLVEVPAI